MSLPKLKDDVLLVFEVQVFYCLHKTLFPFFVVRRIQVKHTQFQVENVPFVSLILGRKAEFCVSLSSCLAKSLRQTSFWTSFHAKLSIRSPSFSSVILYVSVFDNQVLSFSQSTASYIGWWIQKWDTLCQQKQEARKTKIPLNCLATFSLQNTKGKMKSKLNATLTWLSCILTTDSLKSTETTDTLLVTNLQTKKTKDISSNQEVISQSKKRFQNTLSINTRPLINQHEGNWYIEKWVKNK